MRIVSITLENYRPYKGKHTIEFSNINKDLEGRMDIITAKNTVGKSPTFSAISWCLFETEDHYEDTRDKSEPTANLNALIDSKGECRVAVSVELASNDGKHVIVERSMQAKLVNKNEQPYYSKKRLKLQYVGFSENKRDKSWYSLEEADAADFIKMNILDKEIRHFFLIDGEKLRDFFVKESGKAIRESILKVADVEYIKRTSVQVKTLLKEAEEQLGDDEPDVSEYSKKISEIEAALEATKEKKKEQGQLLETCKKQHQKLMEKINDSKNEKYIENVMKIKSIDEKIERAKDEEVSINKSIEENILRNAFAYLLKDEYKQTLDILERDHRKGLIPSYLSDPLLNFIKEKDMCICGRAIPPGSKEEKCIKEYFQLSKYSPLGGKPMEGVGHLKSLLRKADEYEKKEKELISAKTKVKIELRTLNDDRAKLQTEIDSLNIKFSEDEVAEFEERRKKLETSRDSANIVIGKCESQLITLEKQHKEAVEEYQKALQRSKANAAIKVRVDTLRQSQNILLDIEEKIEELIRNDLREKIEQRFFSTGTKESTSNIAKITLDDEFNFDVINKNGWSCLRTMGAGQSLVFTLSVATSLRDMSKYEFPLVIDTPTSRLDADNEKVVFGITNTYPEIHLILLLILNKEYTESLRELISKSIGKEYLLRKNPASGIEVVDSKSKKWAELLKMGGY